MLTDFVFLFGRVITSTLAGAQHAIVASLTGFADSVDDQDTEGTEEQPVYGALGIVSRAKPPDATGAAEVIAARTEDGAIPIAARDLRLSARVNPKDGEICVVQYGGGFLSLADNADGSGTTTVLFAPALLPDGSVSKAHAFILDTSAANESITLVHAQGHGLIADKSGAVYLRNKAGDSYVGVDDNGVTLNGPVKAVTGMLAGDVATAQPVMLAPGLLAWIAQVNAALTALATHVHGGVTAGGASSGPVAGVIPPTSVPLPSTKVSASP